MNHDPLIELVVRLPRVEPDAARSARVRARCHAALASGARPARGRLPHPVLPWRLVAMMGFMYAIEAARQVLLVYRLL